MFRQADSFTVVYAIEIARKSHSRVATEDAVAPVQNIRFIL